MATSSLGNVGGASVPVMQGEATAPRVTAPATTAQTPAAAVSQQSPPSRQAVEHAVQEMKKAMESTSRDLHFSIDSDTQQTVVRVIDSATGDVIRQIPSEELIDIARAMSREQGLLLRQKA